MQIDILYNDNHRKGRGSPSVDVRIQFIEDDKLGDDIEITVRAAERINGRKAVSRALEPFQSVDVKSIVSEKYHLNASRIILIMRDGRYVTAKTAEGDYTIKDALARVEELLDPAWFVRYLSRRS